MNKFIILLKRIFIVLFICAFVINITITSYANSHIKTYNTGAEIIEGLGAALSGGGPFFALVGLSLLTAGLVCESLSDDPTDGAVEYFFQNCIFNDSFAGSALEAIYKNIEIDENGNVNYKQVIDNINAYVEASNIVISTGSAVSFENGVLRVSPEVVSSIAADLRALHRSSPSGEALTYQGNMTYPLTMNLASGLVFPLGSDADLMIKHVITNGLSYVILNTSRDGDGNIELIAGGGYYAYCGINYHWSMLNGKNLSSSSPYGNLYSFDINGNLLNDKITSYLWQHNIWYIYYYGNGFYFDSSILSAIGNPSLPESNDYPIEGWKNLPVRDLYDGLTEDILNVPVVDLPRGNDGTIAIDEGMVNDLEEAFKNVIGVAEGIGDNAVDKDKVITDAITGEISGVIDNAAEREKEDIKTPNVPSADLEELSSPGLKNKFPFCIPFDFIDLISALDAEPEAPKFTIPIIKNEKYGLDYSIEVDWSDFEVVAKVCRSVEVFCFIGFLILKTRLLIRG